MFSRRRGEILAYLVAHGPATGQSVADHLGVHRNSARQHLDRLVAERFVVAVVEHRGLRGRPRVLYGMGTAHAPDVLGPSGVRSALDIARAAERRDGGDPDVAGFAQRALVLDHLDRHGFEPVAEDSVAEDSVAEDGAGLTVQCPITATWAEVGDDLCAAHLSVLERVLSQADGPHATLAVHPHVTPGVCRLRFTPTTDADDPVA
ncbi:hypothetical protein ASF23_12525 [Curtobacterium sp. Leaf261]|nr:hypothetical protein ASF23_12525 [Curtobacterium sp. Leaf261]